MVDDLLLLTMNQYYPTSLEREGRTSLQPYPTVTNVPHNLNDLLHDLESPADLLDLLLPDFEDSDSDSPAIVPTADSTSTEDSPFHRPTGHRPTPTPTDTDDNDDADDESEDLDDNSTSVSSTDKPSTATPTTTDSDTEPSETSNAATSTPSTVLPSKLCVESYVACCLTLTGLRLSYTNVWRSRCICSVGYGGNPSSCNIEG